MEIDTQLTRYTSLTTHLSISAYLYLSIYLSAPAVRPSAEPGGPAPPSTWRPSAVRPRRSSSGRNGARPRRSSGAPAGGAPPQAHSASTAASAAAAGACSASPRPAFFRTARVRQPTRRLRAKGAYGKKKKVTNNNSSNRYLCHQRTTDG